MTDLIDEIMKIVGTLLLAHDSEDIGKLDRVHHWQIGALLLSFPILKRFIEKED